MIDWSKLAINLLWMLGLAIILASLSHHRWQARWRGSSFREQLARPSWRITSSIGMALFCLSFTIDAVQVWESLLWGSLLLFYTAQSVWTAYLK